MINVSYLDACDKLMEGNPFTMDRDYASSLRFEALRGSFEHHYRNNKVYRAFCDMNHVAPDDIKEPGDVTKIALITSDFFKQISAYGDGKDIDKILSVPPEKIVTYFVRRSQSSEA